MAVKVNHNIELRKTNVGTSILEMVEDSMDEVVRRYSEATTDRKKSTIQITIEMEPQFGTEFRVALSRTTKLAPRRSWSGTLHGVLKPDGQVEVTEFDPRQESFDLSDAKQE